MSYCVISAGKGCAASQSRVEWCGWTPIPIPMITVMVATAMPVIRIPMGIHMTTSIVTRVTVTPDILIPR